VSDTVRLSVKRDELPALELAVRCYMDWAMSPSEMREDGSPPYEVHEAEARFEALEGIQRRLVKAIG
jgi:hypothetical protein